MSWLCHITHSLVKQSSHKLALSHVTHS